MTDIHLLKYYSKKAIISILKEYINNSSINVVVTEKNEDILGYPNNDNQLWCNLIKRKEGDVKLSLELFPSFEFDCLRFGLWLSKNKKIESIAEYSKDLPYAEWDYINKDSLLKRIVEDISFEYSDEEDGIKILKIK